jgi:hypothetical protein
MDSRGVVTRRRLTRGVLTAARPRGVFAGALILRAVVVAFVAAARRSGVPAFVVRRVVAFALVRTAAVLVVRPVVLAAARRVAAGLALARRVAAGFALARRVAVGFALARRVAPVFALARRVAVGFAPARVLARPLAVRADAVLRVVFFAAVPLRVGAFAAAARVPAFFAGAFARAVLALVDFAAPALRVPVARVPAPRPPAAVRRPPARNAMACALGFSSVVSSLLTSESSLSVVVREHPLLEHPLLRTVRQRARANCRRGVPMRGAPHCAEAGTGGTPSAGPLADARDATAIPMVCESDARSVLCYLSHRLQMSTR